MLIITIFHTTGTSSSKPHPYSSAIWDKMLLTTWNDDEGSEEVANFPATSKCCCTNLSVSETGYFRSNSFIFISHSKRSFKLSSSVEEFAHESSYSFFFSYASKKLSKNFRKELGRRSWLLWLAMNAEEESSLKVLGVVEEQWTSEVIVLRCLFQWVRGGFQLTWGQSQIQLVDFKRNRLLMKFRVSIVGHCILYFMLISFSFFLVYFAFPCL